jgi:predicted KAP-like P-loop ATPase
VNPVDFIAIEALRVFLPDLYNSIRLNPKKYFPQSERISGQNKDELAAFHDASIEKIERNLKAKIKDVLQRLFPALQSIWGNTHYGPDSLSRWRREKHVCVDDVFPVYFRLEVATGAIGFRDIALFLEIANDRHEIAEHLLALSKESHPSGRTRARALLERLEDYTQDKITPEQIQPILLAIFDIGDTLQATEPDGLGFFDFGMSSQLGRIFFQLIRRISNDRKFTFLVEIANNCSSLAFLRGEIIVLGQMHGKYSSKKKPRPIEEQIVTLAEQENLERIFAARVASASEYDSLIASYQLAYILSSSIDWGEAGVVNAWIQEHKSDNRFIISLLSSMLSVGHSVGMGFGSIGDRVSVKTHKIDLDFLRRFLDPLEVEPIARQALIGIELSERERKALGVFLDTLGKREHEPS